jgi:hypothetical protein
MNVIWKFFGFLKDLLSSGWKLTLAAIFGAIVGICLMVIATCGEILREVITGERTPADAVTQIIAIATRDGGVTMIGALSLTLLGGATFLAIAKFRTEIARQNALKRKYDGESMGKILPFTEERRRQA